MFRRLTIDETFLLNDETISRFWRRHPETTDRYQFPDENGARRQAKTGDSQMRTLSFILAFAFVLGGPSLAGSSENTLPGVGTFAYNGPSMAVAPQTAAHKAIVVAAR